MIGHALKTLPRTVFLVGETNQRSRRAMEKIGGVLLNRQQVFNWEGADIIHVIYAVDRDGFATGPLATG
ncbi:MAG: hypothetical protein U5J78_03015 [Parasphingorhabdus sp.]|nr:hypothetical protein [Parasphingorhabdus sp.]